MVKGEELKVGDHVWVSKLSFSDRGNMTLGLFAELEKVEGANRFRVVKVEKGTSLKKGGFCSLSGKFYRTREDAIESWNRNLYNTIDRLTSEYEQTIKRVKKKILKDD